MIDTVISEVWTQVLLRARSEIGERAWSMWLEKSSLISLKRGTLVFGVPNLFIRDWVQDHYGELLARLAGEELGTDVRIGVKVDPGLFREMRARTEKMEEMAGSRVDHSDGKTLDSFLPTAGSKAAIAALRHLAGQASRPNLSPLVIHGPAASGKSHLAAGVQSMAPSGVRVLRMTAEVFGRRFSLSLKSHRVDAFRDENAQADLFVIDDAQDFENKFATQRELLSLAEEIRARGGRVAIFSRLHPSAIPDLEPGFRSFLLSGHVVPLDPPAGPERRRVVDAMLRTSGRRFPPEVVRLVLERMEASSVAEAARAVRKLYALAGLTGEPVDEKFLDQHLAEVMGPTDPVERKFEAILRAVEDRYAVDREDLLAKRKIRALAMPRAVAIWLLRERAGLTFKEIGRRFGQRSHTSVFLAHQKLAEALPDDRSLAATLTELSRRVEA